MSVSGLKAIGWRDGVLVYVYVYVHVHVHVCMYVYNQSTSDCGPS
jgi:hypothetical protein